MKIQQQTIRRMIAQGYQKFFARSISYCLPSRRSQQASQRAAHGFIIFDDGDKRR